MLAAGAFLVEEQGAAAQKEPEHEQGCGHEAQGPPAGCHLIFQMIGHHALLLRDGLSQQQPDPIHQLDTLAGADYPGCRIDP